MGRRRARSPLPQRAGLDAVWVRTPARVGDAPAPFGSIRDFLRARLPGRVPVDDWLATGRFVDATGRPIPPDAPYTPATFVWFHKDLSDEPNVPDLEILHRDERIVVVDKPHFLATIPRGGHVQASALVKLRRQLDLPDLAPAHRLDRLTAGVLLLTTAQRWRAPYQQLFAHHLATKTYEALAPALPHLATPTLVRSHLVKRRGSLRAEEVAGEPPNAETLVTLVETRGVLGRYRLEPRTGRTHQLRVHLTGLGAPIVGDPLYPTVSDAPEVPTRPLRLVARTLAFTDPVEGTIRSFSSRSPLGW
ncbi:MAG TPA: pseudouridylate synthase [Propionibacterium sp.]|nr:pseudouridylate synthase [Propionibacterium sp.]